MKHFETIRKSLVQLGITQNQGNNRHYPFSRQYFTINFIYAFGACTVSAFAFHVADNVNEYMDSFFVLIVLGGIYSSYTIVIFNMKKLFRLFDNCEQFIDDGE